MGLMSNEEVDFATNKLLRAIECGDDEEIKRQAALLVSNFLIGVNTIALAVKRD